MLGRQSTMELHPKSFSVGLIQVLFLSTQVALMTQDVETELHVLQFHLPASSTFSNLKTIFSLLPLSSLKTGFSLASSCLVLVGPH